MIEEQIAREIEPHIRELISAVIDAKQSAQSASLPDLAADLFRIEYKLGSMLPPIRGTLRLTMDQAKNFGLA